MGSWSEITNEIGTDDTRLTGVRKKYLHDLFKYTGRNIITYYSGWLNNELGVKNYDINDNDMEGFMNCVNGLNCDRGLDLILHTPGGSPTATESIVNYLRCKFNNNIRVIVPHMAMSAGTMIACSGKEIVMGKHSSLGPIDPQFGGIPAYNIKQEFEDAKRDLVKNPKNTQYWAIQLGKYPPAFMKNAIDAIELSTELTTNWLKTCMLKDEQDRVSDLVKALNEHEDSKNHGRHFNFQKCKEIGLKVIELEKDTKLQNKVLSVHHCYMIAIQRQNLCKIIENHNSKTFFIDIKERR